MLTVKYILPPDREDAFRRQICVKMSDDSLVKYSYEEIENLINQAIKKARPN